MCVDRALLRELSARVHAELKAACERAERGGSKVRRWRKDPNQWGRTEKFLCLDVLQRVVRVSADVKPLHYRSSAGFFSRPRRGEARRYYIERVLVEAINRSEAAGTPIELEEPWVTVRGGRDPRKCVCGEMARRDCPVHVPVRVASSV